MPLDIDVLTLPLETENASAYVRPLRYELLLIVSVGIIIFSLISLLIWLFEVVSNASIG